MPGLASDEQIRLLQSRYDLTLPNDFRTYLQTVCPATDLWDVEDGNWWSFDRIKNIPDEYRYEISEPTVAAHASRYLFFMDYLIWSHAWAISCTDDENRGRVVFIGGMPDCFVADSFTDFVERYVKDWMSVWPARS